MHADPEARRVYMREYKRRWRRARGAKERLPATPIKIKREMVAKLKDRPCADCGGRFPAVCMDFDHRDPAGKTAGIAALVGGKYSMATILAEIEKCDLVCANCHRIRTHGGLNVNITDFLRIT